RLYRGSESENQGCLRQVRTGSAAKKERRVVRLAPGVRSCAWVQLSFCGDETVHHQFSARFVEIDRQLRAVYGDDSARPELVVKHPRARMKTRGGAGLSVD